MRHCLTFNNLSGLIPQITRSNSAPDILCLVESAPKHPDPFSTSPRTVAMNLKQQSAHGPSSYKETSELEKKYQEESVFIRDNDFSGADTHGGAVESIALRVEEIHVVSIGQETTAGHTGKQVTRHGAEDIQKMASHTSTSITVVDVDRTKPARHNVDKDHAIGAQREGGAPQEEGQITQQQSGQTNQQQIPHQSAQQQVKGQQQGHQSGGHHQQGEHDDNMEPLKRPRGHTISVMATSKSAQPGTRLRSTGTMTNRDGKSGLSPR